MEKELSLMFFSLFSAQDGLVMKLSFCCLILILFGLGRESHWVFLSLLSSSTFHMNAFTPSVAFTFCICI